MSTPDPADPACGTGFDLFAPFVILSATATTGPETVTVQEQVDRAAWRYIDRDPGLRAGYERRLRQKLGEALVDRIDPAITVHEPPVPPGRSDVRRAGSRRHSAA
ncbi:hypothetical protein [Streptomyces sp. NPDC046976]|uniref:hypothetical protein n=1 Tax=Streptomyces sp. NPDC046976 TaxID=3155258 RepID=UPI0033EF5471